jgi:23S rRNA pseudouridine2604 synthase
MSSSSITPPKLTQTEHISRLNKRLSELGFCSRREADHWIEQGWVKVNGSVAKIGMQVGADAVIEVEKAAAQQQSRQVTILLNKPIGYVSGQAEDGHEPAITLINFKNRWRDDRHPAKFSPQHLRGLAPAGRLDIDSVGLLVLTQDGRVARQLIGENSELEKEYLVRVQLIQTDNSGSTALDLSEVFPGQSLALLRHGLKLDGKPLKPAKVDWQNSDQLRFVLKEGKKRQIRRMCEQVGLKVTGLKRIRVGQVLLGNLPPGQWRYLQPNEHF